MSENETTLCGGCLERVYVNRLHACEPIKELKRKIDSTLMAIQQDYERKFQEVNGTLRNHRSLNAHLESQISDLKRELSSCIDVKLLYSDRQARETWQAGCDVMIETLHKRVIDMDFMLKNSLLCVDNSHANDAAKYYGLAPIAQLNQIAKEVPHHPSRKHLENKLREKNLRIKELEDQLCMRNHECQAALNESNSLRNELVNRQRQLDNCHKIILELKHKLEHYDCKKICCLPTNGCYV